MAWLEFALALAAFMASHLIPSRAGLRAALVARLGRGGYGAAYGLLSLALFVWVIVAAGRAPFVLLWDQQIWMRWLANLAMPLAVLLTCLGFGAPNPLSLGGRAGGFDPARPGIVGVVRHPLLWALLLWALAHLLVNGDLAHVILFGLLALYCVIGMRMIDRRQRRVLPDWARLAAGTSNLPFMGNWRGWWPDWWRVLLTVVIWIGLLHAHPPVIGVSPLPWG